MRQVAEVDDLRRDQAGWEVTTHGWEDRGMTDRRHLLADHAEVLAFERAWWAHAGAKDDAIRERFGVDAADYYLALAEVIDHPDALEHDALLVRRLQRQRAARRRERSARRLRDA